MSYNNELYIFSEVPGYDASKGERIVKAFQKLREKIEYLEQVRISEKNASSKKVSPNSDSELTITDVQSEILLTQIRYIIKIIREYANDKQSNLDVKNYDFKAVQETKSSVSNNSRLKSIPYENGCSNFNESTLRSECNVIDSNSEDINRQKQGNFSSVINAESTQKQSNSTEPCVGVSHKQTKLNCQSHYHLKLDDVPFILGASSSASHSVVANVQNIIAMMKSHNKALCAPKHQNINKKSSSIDVNKFETGKANDMMIRELTEDLSSLAHKQEKMKKMFPQPSRHEKTKFGLKLRGENSSKGKTKNRSASNSSDIEKCMLPNLSEKDKKQSQKKHSESCEASEKHSIMSIRMQSNSNPQLARRKMLRSLKDFKTHLLEEDISWE